MLVLKNKPFILILTHQLKRAEAMLHRQKTKTKRKMAIRWLKLFKFRRITFSTNKLIQLMKQDKSTKLLMKLTKFYFQKENFSAKIKTMRMMLKKVVILILVVVLEERKQIRNIQAIDLYLKLQKILQFVPFRLWLAEFTYSVYSHFL